MERPSPLADLGQGRTLVILAATLLATSSAGHTAKAAGDADRGEILYQGCQDCHSIEKNDVGPMHRGVVGRASGTVPGYNYSPALRNAKIVWTEESQQVAYRSSAIYSRHKDVL